MSEPLSRSLRDRLSGESLVVSSTQEFIDAPRDARTVSFLDGSTLAALDELALAYGKEVVPPPNWRRLVAAVSLGPVILISSDPIRATINGLQPHPWLSHILSATMLEHRMAAEHIGHVMQAATTTDTPRLMDWLGTEVAARRIRIAHASKRIERLERMSEFFTSQGVSERTVHQIRDVAEELLTNVFYNAPVAAGAVKDPIPRSQDVSLPADSACDLIYGTREDLAFVRVRDPFGSLSRSRLVEVLARCARTEKVEVDSSMGGSGLGLWRVVNAASLLSILVVNNHHTEVLVGIIDRPAAGQRPFAFHMFVKDGAKRRSWTSANQDTGVSEPTFNTSVAIVLKD
ncbi:MAG: response regulator receiver protein [Myxococcales bacterium]|nr:response regulator receiver protein [Myxococcales bacterium]